jgi:pimeloyl-ACP methyl ester carboxylesterase
MKAPTVLAAAAALILGDAAPAATLESTSATTTYHSMTVGGVGVFYREAGPKDAPTLVLLHGFPSSSREFDTLIPLLATHYHLIAPDFPGFGQSDAPPPSSYEYTFDQLAKTIGDLLEQLKISKCSFYLHDYGGPVGFRIILAHPERVQALIIQNANAYREGLAQSGPALRSIGPIRKRIPRCSMPLYRWQRPNSVTRWELRIPIGTTPIPGPTSTPICRNPGNMRSRLRCSTMDERRLISGVAGVVARARAADLGGVGTERSLVHCSWGGGIQARSAECRDSSARCRPFCLG